MKKTIKLILVSMLTINLYSPIYAHHSAIAFDKTKSVIVTGSITRSVWRNPHMAINIDVDSDINY